MTPNQGMGPREALFDLLLHVYPIHVNLSYNCPTYVNIKKLDIVDTD